MATFETLKKWIDDAETVSENSRKLAERDRDYYDGKQLTAEEKKVLAARGQPEIIDNVIKPAIDHLHGTEVQRRTDPKALPRTPRHEQDAESITDALNFVEGKTGFDRTASACWRDKLIEGICGVDVGVEDVNGKFEVYVRPIAWNRLGYDPHSVSPDFSDARYLYYLTWMDADEARAMWPDKEAVIVQAMDRPQSSTDTYDDVPRYAWTDSKRKRVKICYVYYKWPSELGLLWHKAIMVGSDFVEEPQPSPYLDDTGQPECPLVFSSMYVDRDGNRYGMVRNLVTLQDAINKRQSKLLDMLNRRQVIATKGAVEDVRLAKAELAKTDGWIERTQQGEVTLVPQVDHAQGHFALLAEARASVGRLGPAPIERGKPEGGAPSGRAVLALEQAGNVEQAPAFDEHSWFKRRVYQAIWNRIRQYWTEERWIRVTDDVNGVKFVGLNKPVTFGEMALEQMQAQGIPEAQAKQAIMSDPQSQMMMVQNAVSEIDVDIILEEAPDMVTLQHEQFAVMADLARSGAVQFPPKVWIEMAPALRNKQRLIDAIEGTENPEAVAQQQALQQAAIQQEMRDKAAQTAKTEAETALKKADTFKTLQEGQKVAAEIGNVRIAGVKTAVDAAATMQNATKPPPMPGVM